LHGQAKSLHDNSGRGRIALFVTGDRVGGIWDETSKAKFLLCAMALENAIKAFLVYEHPEWVANGCLHKEITSHRLVHLGSKSSLIPYRARDSWVLAAFEEGNESWMRYPCARRADQLSPEPDFSDALWRGYRRVMKGYGKKLSKLLSKGWKGSHGKRETWEFGWPYLD
jgi:hypothetical protein